MVDTALISAPSATHRSPPAPSADGSPHIIPILADSAARGGCGHCHSGHGEDSQPVCAAPLRCDNPVLTGTAAELAPVLAALQDCPDLAGLGIRSGVVSAVSVKDGEVDILLQVGACGAGAQLVHAVFDFLRQRLLDTDIYVRPAG